MMLMVWVSRVFSFWSMNQRVDFKYRKLVIFTLAASILQPTVSIIFMLHSSNKVLARIFGIAVVQFALYAWMFVDMMAKGKTFYSKRYWTYALRFNIPLLPHYLSMNVLSSSDRIMIGNMVGTSEVGIYNLAYSISLIMTMFNNALLQTIEPWIYRKLKENKATDIAQVAYAIAPGPTATPMLAKKEGDSIYEPYTPSHRYAMPEELASLALFMVSGAGNMIVGDTVYMTGGSGTITMHH